MLPTTTAETLIHIRRKAPDYRCLTAGLVLSVHPMMAHTMLALWGLSALCGAGLYVMQKWS
jgi:hypothetical protein